MKKFLTLVMLTCGAMSYAQEVAEAVVIHDATARKISPDGKWVGCHGTSIVVYNVENNSSEIYPECSIGNGNAMSLDGTTVGLQYGNGAFMKGGEIIVPEIFVNSDCGLNGITSDGTRVVGYAKNPLLKADDGDPYDSGIPVYLPFYCDVNEDGSVEKFNFLPVPEKDFLGETPMYFKGIWISDDGKTMLGVMIDSFGRFEDPILFKESENGEWTYSTPTREFFNPQHIELPENPWEKAPQEPNYRDYMTPLQYQAYMDAWENYFLNGGPEVNPFDYMSDEMAQKYIEDYEKYANYFDDHIAEINEYEKAYRELLTTSIYFGEAAMDPQGAYFASNAVYYDEEGTNSSSKIIIFNTQTGENQIIESQYPGLKVYQVLSDGTIIAYTGLFTYDALQGYIYLPGEEDFVPFSNYLASINPTYYDWLAEVFPNGEGIVSLSQDMTVAAGGVDVLSAVDPSDFPDSIILSYVLPNLKTSASVESIEIPVNDGIYHVYNLMGVKILETKDKSDIKNLGKGIFIVNGKKILL